MKSTMNGGWRAVLLGCVKPLLLWSLVQGTAVFAETQTRTSSFEYDFKGHLIKEVVEPDRPNDCLVTTYALDAYGNRVSSSSSACAGASGSAVSSAGAARVSTSNYVPTTTSMDIEGKIYAVAAGQFAYSSANALGHKESRDYDPRFGAVRKLTGPNGLSTTWDYDKLGRKIKEVRADGTYTTWSYAYCSNGGATAVGASYINCPNLGGGIVAAWAVTQTEYAKDGSLMAAPRVEYFDWLSRLVRSESQDFSNKVVVQDTVYNGLGQVVQKSQVYALSGGNPNWSLFTYDALGRPIGESHPDENATGGMATSSTSYNGLTVVSTNAKGQTRTTIKNTQGQVAQVLDAQGNSLIYRYDALGQLIQTNAAGNISSIQYDQRGRKVAMQDAAMGSWTYAYNAFGELVSQTDSLNQTSTMAYDLLGRLIQKTEADLVSNWFYDKDDSGLICGKSTGKLCVAKSNNGYRRIHKYDELGRPNQEGTTLDTPNVLQTMQWVYDGNTGRVQSQTWPTGYTATYSYSKGYLISVQGAGTNMASSRIDMLAYDSQGRVTQYKQGNNVVTTKTYQEATGRLLKQVANLQGGSAGAVQNASYSYDTLSNLTSRTDANTAVAENFSYDNLNRLNLYTVLGGSVSPANAIQVQYDARGNITYKSDVGQYWYDSARPNRMTNVTLSAPAGAQPLTGTRTLSYAFDDYQIGAKTVNGTVVGNGNLMYTVSHDQKQGIHTLRWESYSSFNMPREIKYTNIGVSENPNATSVASKFSDRTLSYVYGPEHQRIKEVVQLSGNGTSAYASGTTWYMNGEGGQSLSYEKEIKSSGVTEHRHYLNAVGIAFAVVIQRSGTGVTTTSTGKAAQKQVRYFQTDHLGSIAVITDESGQVIERLAYDPWGKRRNINGNTDTTDSLVGQTVSRGYTMHEHLDEVGVIHMNGRVYDPLIGRMMSADPYIQSPDNLQSHNRYVYVMNNPLAMTDPSGYFSWSSFRDKVVKPVVVIAVTYYTGGLAGAFVGGFLQSVLYGGNLQQSIRAGLIQMATAAAFSYVGANYKAGSITNYTGHAVVGCVSAVAQGGQCGSGAAAAVFGKFATNAIGGEPGKFEAWQFSATVVAGGVGSVITGGKFENGAMTAAYGYLFNYLQGGRDLTSEEGKKISSNAAKWEGTPYASVGTELAGAAAQEGIGADCSGSTCKIYDQTGNVYRYKRSGQFAAAAAQEGFPFRVLTTNESLQQGDVILFKGHMAIYSGKDNGGDAMMWTARREGRPYIQMPVKSWGTQPIDYYRYQVPGKP